MASEPDARGRAQARQLLDAVRPATSTVPSEMTVTRFPSSGTDLHGLGEALSRWYTAQGLESDMSAVPGGVHVRCRSQGGHSLIGVARGLTVVLRQDGGEVAVEIGAARWSDKAWVAGAGVLLMSTGIGIIPLATSAFGAYRQWRLPVQTLEFLRATAPTFSGARRGGTHTGPSVSAAAAPASQPPAGHGAGAAPSIGSTGTVDVNDADVASLATVPGLDVTVAGRIVATRDRLGGFRSWEQVRDVLSDSLPPHRLASARHLLTVGPPRTEGQPRPDGDRGPLEL